MGNQLLGPPTHLRERSQRSMRIGTIFFCVGVTRQAAQDKFLRKGKIGVPHRRPSK